MNVDIGFSSVFILIVFHMPAHYNRKTPFVKGKIKIISFSFVFLYLSRKTKLFVDFENIIIKNNIEK